MTFLKSITARSVFNQIRRDQLTASQGSEEMIKAREGLVQKDVEVKRGGKTFKQKRWVRPDEAVTAKKPGKKEEPIDTKLSGLSDKELMWKIDMAETKEDKKKYNDERERRLKERAKDTAKPADKEKPAVDTDTKEKSQAEIEKGLGGWVKDYNEAVKSGNTKAAAQLKRAIDGVVKDRGLDTDHVYGHKPAEKEGKIAQKVSETAGERAAKRTVSKKRRVYMTAKRQTEKANLLRNNMPGYVGGKEITDLASDKELLEIANAKDKQAEYYNAGNKEMATKWDKISQEKQQAVKEKIKNQALAFREYEKNELEMAPLTKKKLKGSMTDEEFRKWQGMTEKRMRLTKYAFKGPKEYHTYLKQTEPEENWDYKQAKDDYDYNVKYAE